MKKMFGEWANSAHDAGKGDMWNDHVASESSVSFNRFSTSTVKRLAIPGEREHALCLSCNSIR
jgi:hypothetical protein